MGKKHSYTKHNKRRRTKIDHGFRSNRRPRIELPVDEVDDKGGYSVSKQLRKLQQLINDRRRAIIDRTVTTSADAIERAILLGPLTDAMTEATNAVIDAIETDSLAESPTAEPPATESPVPTEQREVGSYDASEESATQAES